MSTIPLAAPALSGIPGGSATPNVKGTAAPLYYFIVTRYPAGIAYPLAPIIASQVQGVPTATTTITLSWPAMPGATGYDILRSNTPNVPSGVCAVALNQSATTYTDTGTALQNYVPGAAVQNVSALIELDNSGTAPTVKIVLPSGVTQIAPATAPPGEVAGGPFASGNIVTGAGGQNVQDSGTALSSLPTTPISAANGGTGIDTSASTGVPVIAAGTWSVDTVTGTGKVVKDTSPTIVTPTVASFVNATHNHQAAAGGGTLAEAALALTDVTTNNVSATAHGFAPKFPNNTTTFLRGDGTYAAPSGGGSTGYGTYATLPATPGATGAIYKASDAPFVFYGASASVWDAWFLDSKVTIPPTIAGGTWTQRNTPTVADLQGSILLTAPAVATNNLVSITQTWNASNGATVLLRGLCNLQFSQFGLSLTDGTKYYTMSIGLSGSTLVLQMNQWSNATTFSSTAQTSYVPYFGGDHIWCRIIISAGNRLWQVSHNGQNWLTVYTEADNTFLTETAVGVTIQSDNATYAATVEILSWSN